MFIVIAGAGKVGYYLLKNLINSGQEAVVIEKNAERCNQIAEEFGSVYVIGDACDPQHLEEAGIPRASIIVAVTGDDEDNLVICQIAKKKFNVPYTIARVNNPKNEEILKKLGINATVSSTDIILKMIAQEVAYQGILTHLPLKKGVEIVESRLNKDAPCINTPLKDLQLPTGCIIAGVIRNEEWIIPNGNSILLAGDMIIALSKEENFEKLKGLLLGKYEGAISSGW